MKWTMNQYCHHDVGKLNTLKLAIAPQIKAFVVCFFFSLACCRCVMISFLSKCVCVYVWFVGLYEHIDVLLSQHKIKRQLCIHLTRQTVHKTWLCVYYNRAADAKSIVGLFVVFRSSFSISSFHFSIFLQIDVFFFFATKQQFVHWFLFVSFRFASSHHHHHVVRWTLYSSFVLFVCLFSSCVYHFWVLQ